METVVCWRRESLIVVSCVLGSEEKGRSGVIVVMNSCVRRLVEFRRVLEELPIVICRSVIWDLY
jgi:hypothetical protein